MAKKESIGEYVDIDSLIEWEKNPRINDHAVSKVARSIERFGFASPIIAKQSDKPPYIILAGHTRFRASKQIGLQNVPVRFLNISQTEAELFAIADNKLGEIADWDHDMLKDILENLPENDLEDVGFSSEELNDLILTDFGIDEDIEDITNNNKYTDAEIIEDAYNYFKKNGFPYPCIPLMEMKQQINKLANLSNDKCPNNTIAYKVADTFHPHRFHVSAIGMRSPIESFSIEKSLRKALKMDLENGGIGSKRLANMTLVNGTQACSNFRPAYAKMMYEKYAKSEAIVFDSSTGYGGRLVGFLASKCKSYIGVDPNILTHKANLELFNKLKNGNKTCKLINLPAEDVNVDKEKIRNLADFSFTSPPYFKKEIYSEQDNQSCHRYNNYDDWINSFLIPMMKLNYEVVKSGGKTIINIEDVNIKGKIYPLVNPTIEAGKEVGFTFIRLEKFLLQNRTRIIDGEKITIESFERVIIFQKP